MFINRVILAIVAVALLVGAPSLVFAQTSGK